MPLYRPNQPTPRSLAFLLWPLILARYVFQIAGPGFRGQGGPGKAYVSVPSAFRQWPTRPEGKAQDNVAREGVCRHFGRKVSGSLRTGQPRASAYGNINNSVSFFLPSVNLFDSHQSHGLLTRRLGDFGRVDERFRFSIDSFWLSFSEECRCLLFEVNGWSRKSLWSYNPSSCEILKPYYPNFNWLNNFLFDYLNNL